jgi:hypothetical protein
MTACCSNDELLTIFLDESASLSKMLDVTAYRKRFSNTGKRRKAADSDGDGDDDDDGDD